VVRRLSRVPAAIATALLLKRQYVLTHALATHALAIHALAQKLPLQSKQQTSKKVLQRAMPIGTALFFVKKSLPAAMVIAAGRDCIYSTEHAFYGFP